MKSIKVYDKYIIRRMENKNSITGQESRAVKLFGSELAERIKRLMKLNGDETIGDFILNSAFEFLDELELKFKSSIKKVKAGPNIRRTLNLYQDNSAVESKTGDMEKMVEIANKIMEICGYDTMEDFIHNATHNFLDRIERWFEPSSPLTKEPSKVFHFDSKIENIIDNDSKIKACKKFQVIMQKEFVSYIQRIHW